MKSIKKNNEPRTLEEHRCNSCTTYDNYAFKDDLRQALVEEQYSLCCYCMQRIQADRTLMKVEHWRCQTRYPGEQLIYRNLLGACLGNHGKPGRLQHCDTFKKDKELSRNPANGIPAVDHDIRYLPNGSIISNDADFNRELNDVLNLNLDFLERNRKAVLDALNSWADRTGRIRKADIRAKLRDWSQPQNGALREYCGVAIYWLQKKLARM